MINQSEQITNLAAALLKAQRDIGSALKKADNPYFKSKYADLGAVIDAVKGPLNDHGITFLQAVDCHEIGDHAVIDTILLHESGQYLSTRTPIFCSKTNDPQAFGSGISYSKRYALQALLGLPTEDDDGEKAMGRQGNGNGSKTTNIKEVIAQAHAEYIAANQADIPEHFSVPLEAFTAELKAEAKKQIPANQRKDFAWTVESVKPFALCIDVTKVLVEDK